MNLNHNHASSGLKSIGDLLAPNGSFEIGSTKKACRFCGSTPEMKTLEMPSGKPMFFYPINVDCCVEQAQFRVGLWRGVVEKIKNNIDEQRTEFDESCRVQANATKDPVEASRIRGRTYRTPASYLSDIAEYAKSANQLANRIKSGEIDMLRSKRAREEAERVMAENQRLELENLNQIAAFGTEALSDQALEVLA